MAEKLPAREVTPEALYLRRRELIKNGALFVGSAAAMSSGLWALTRGGASAEQADVIEGSGDDGPDALAVATRGQYLVDEALTPLSAVTSYNNFYELGLDKADPARNAASLKPRPWTVAITGAVAAPMTLDIDDLIRRFPLEERVYRMRCVEAWSMVIPWLGFPLRSLIDLARPLASARYVAFETLKDPQQLPGQQSDVLPWPYIEGLRIDEATHPLTLLAVGLYGRSLPNQNGAPLRLVVPWKYGFKGIKSIVRIHFQEDLPHTTWNLAAPNEYGFYANVNPAVDHPRWSQASERRVGELARRPTLPFNGYAHEVAALYQGLDLARSF